MNTVTRSSRFLVIAGLLAVLSLGQLVYAQNPEGCPPAVPQWVKDRQQYETSYVYVPPAACQSVADPVPPIPQWVKDRQQYETSYVYVPCQSTAETVFPIPQWVKDRQQYETSYIYVPPAADFSAIYNRCGQLRTPGR